MLLQICRKIFQIPAVDLLIPDFIFSGHQRSFPGGLTPPGRLFGLCRKPCKEASSSPPNPNLVA